MTVRDWSRFPKVFLKIHISINIGLRLFEVSLYTEAHGRVHSDLHINLFKKKFIWRMCFAITCATVSNESAGTSDPMTHRKWRPHAPQMTLQGFCVYQRSSIPHGKAPTRSQDDAARLLCISEFINITWGSAHAHPRRRYKASVYIWAPQYHMGKRPHAPKTTLQGFYVYQSSSNTTWDSAHAHPRRHYKASMYISLHQCHSARVYSSKIGFIRGCRKTL